jgi:hypothetical protein
MNGINIHPALVTFNLTLEVLNMTVAIIAANLPLFEQSSSDFDNPARKILHDFYAGDFFGLDKAELFVML